VVAGGEASDDLAASETALTAALREADSVQVVMDSSAIGNVSGLGDSDIVGKASNLPVDQIAIVRVFPGKEGTASVVVTLYTKDGEAAGGFSASTDKPLEAKAGGGGGTGTGMDPGRAIGAIARTNDAESQKAFDEYLERRVFFQGMAAVSSQTGTVMSTWSVPYKGKYREPLNGTKFYEYVGHEEIVPIIRKRKLIKTGIALGSIGLMSFAVWDAVKNAEDSYDVDDDCWELDNEDEEDDCDDDVQDEKDDIEENNKKVAIRATVFGSLGFIGIYVPMFIQADPTPVSDRYRMADEYNAKLREELGLPEDLSGFRGASDFNLRLSLNGFANRNGGGAGFTLEF
jgi:hypothetical protein